MDTVRVASRKLFPVSDSPLAVYMKEGAGSQSGVSKPNLYVSNVSTQAYSGFTVRLWVSREEQPQADVALDPYAASPCGTRFKVRPSSDIPNVVAVDVVFPESFTLAPGASTTLDGLSFGLHYRNPAAASWSRSNDWSWNGIGAEYTQARNAAVYDRDGHFLGGIELDPSDVAITPAGTVPPLKERVARDLQALYFFHEGAGDAAADLSGAGIPMDLAIRRAGNHPAWIATGGLDFQVQDHNAILENVTPNPKLFNSMTQKDEMTLEVWISPANLTQTSARLISHAPANGNLERNWDLLQNGRNIEFRLRTSGSASVSLATTGNPLATAGTLYHVTATYKPYSVSTGKGGLRIHVNGTLAASNQEAGTLNEVGSNAWNGAYILTLGNLPGIPDRDWQGRMYLASAYSGVLTDAEVLQNRDAGLREPSLRPAMLAGVTCGDRLLPDDIADGYRPWIEDAAADGATMVMGGTRYAKGLGGQPGSAGETAFLIYDLNAEGIRVGLAGAATRLTGFAGRRDGSVPVNASVKISPAPRKPSDQDWLQNAGSVMPLFTSNNGSNLPVDLGLNGARWLFLGQSGGSPGSAAHGLFGDFKVHYGDLPGGSTPPEFLGGMEYAYFEGTWNCLPDFSVQLPVQNGMVSGIDLSPRLRSDLIAMEFTGFIRISAGGTYTFYTSSDDGSQLFVDGQRIVDNDGMHGEREASGTVYLAPGMHPLRVTYFENSGGEVLKASYQGPGIPKTRIPSSELFRPGPGTLQGVQRIRAGLQALYDFRKQRKDMVHDFSTSGIPLDLALEGANASWIEGGGVAFLGLDHNSILENRTPNAKLYNSLIETGELSLEAWFHPGDLALDDFQDILDLGSRDASGQRNFSMIQKGRDLQFALRTSGNSGVTLNTTDQPLSVSNRYHLVMAYKPNGNGPDGGMRIYLNGILMAVNAEAGSLPATGPNAWGKDFILAVGNRATTLDRDWSGKILLAAVYNRALTPEQVLVNYKAGIPSGPSTEIYPVGVTSLDRVLPRDIQDGNQLWEEDKTWDGLPLSMGGYSYRVGLSGKPIYSGAFSSMLYDVESERKDLGVSGLPLRLTGFAGRQDGSGDVRLTIKTSRLSAAPTLSDWHNNTGGVVERLSVENGANAPVEVDLDQAKWIWLAQSGTDPGNLGQGVFGQLKIHFGHGSAGNLESGLKYGYYEIAADLLPNFDALIPARTGLAESFGVVPALRADNFALEFKGFIQIHTQGTYTFYTSSDDGSRLFIDGRIVVDNDGLHGLRENFGSVALTPGYHAIKVHYFDKTGSQVLEVRYQGPGLAKQAIPANVLFHSASFGYGLEAKYHEGRWDVLPDFGALVPKSSDVRANFRISPRARDDDFAFVFDGYFYLPVAGDYTFFLNSDDGSRVSIDGAPVIDNDGLHAAQERSKTLSLASGFHAVRVAYMERGGRKVLDVKFQGPGFAKTAFPSEMLFQTMATALPNPTPCTKIQCGKEFALVMGGQAVDRNYAIAGSQWFKVPLSQHANSWAHAVVVALDDMNGRTMEGTFQFENDAVHGLNTWFQSFQTPYTGQDAAYFVIKVPGDRLYKVRWWFQ